MLHLLVHDDGAQLAVVSHQDDLLGAQHQRHQRLRLRGLRALVHQQLRAPAHPSPLASHPSQSDINGAGQHVRLANGMRK